MHKLIVAAAGAAALVAASSLSAFAAEVTGAITAVDPTTNSVTLDDGNVYLLPAEFDVAAFQAGTNVTFTYEDVDGKRTVSLVSSPG